jgi:polar amino acid transport system substrate-binding protein
MHIIKAALLSLSLVVSYGAYSKEIRIATFEHDTPQVDAAIKVMTALYQRIGLDMVIIRFPGKRSLVQANLGSTAGELMRIKSIEKSYPNLVRVPYAIGSLTAVAVVRSGQPQISEISELLGKRIGILRGIEFTEKLTKNLDREVLNSINSLFSILLSGRVDVILFPDLDARKSIKSHGLGNKLDIGARPVVDIPLYHFLHKNSQDIAEDLSKEMKGMKQNGELEKLIQSAEQPQN